jgi:predicted dehydrogenase
MLKVGIVGLGEMGKNHLRVLKDLRGVSVVGVVDPVEKNIDIQMSIEKLISLNPDYCVISVPTKFHLDVTLQLIEAGIHFLIEKPMSIDSMSATTIISESERCNVKGAVGYIERSNSAMIKAKDLLNQDFLGKIIQISTRRRGPNPMRIKDVGVLKDLATHDFDSIIWLTEMKFKSIYASSYSKDINGNEDLISCVGKLEGMINATCNVDWITPTKIREVHILGENGALQIDTLNSDLIHFNSAEITSTDRFISHLRGRAQGDITNIAFPKREALFTEHENFRDYINGESVEIATLREALQVIKVAEAATLSCAENKLVYL